MSRKYKVDDLFKLRESPLVAKPPSLPPNEEWMGNQDTAARRTSAPRGKAEDSVLREGFQKRPNLGDRKSTTSTADIHLGPPIRKFQSSRKVSTQEEVDEATKTKDDGDSQLKETDEADAKLSERRATRHDGMNGRLTSRVDKEAFQNSRFRRRDDEVEQQDSDRTRPSWRVREGRTDNEAVHDEQENCEENNRAARRDGAGRTRRDLAWGRGEKTVESVNDGRRFESRQSEWRRNRDWNQPERVEANPEWNTDSAELEETTQAHSQGDFQKWMDSMKKKGAVSETPAQPQPIATSTEEKNVVKSQPASEMKSPGPQDAMDQFLANFKPKEADTEAIAVATKPQGKTRFANFFNAPPSTPSEPTLIATPQAEEPPASHLQQPSMVDADKAGFNRILQMLGDRSSNASPQDQVVRKKHMPLLTKAEPETQGRLNSPDLASMLTSSEETPRTRTSRNFDRYLDSTSPEEPIHVRQESTEDTRNILVNLMRQANIDTQAPPQQPVADESHYPRDMLPMPETINRFATSRTNRSSASAQQEARRDTSSDFFDGIRPHIVQYQEEPSLLDFQNNGLRRRPTNGAPPNFYDEPFLRQPNQKQNLMPANQMPVQGLPPGLHRPPGFDNVPRMPPGWPNRPQQQQQAGLPRQAPPPGIPNLPRGMPAPFSAGNMSMPPLPQHLQQQQPPNPNMQRPPQRKYTGDSGLGLPPAMAPPPGFMSNGPPPGFPGAPQNYGRFQIGGEQPGMRGGLGDMYGERNVRASGGGGMAGGYR